MRIRLHIYEAQTQDKYESTDKNCNKFEKFVTVGYRDTTIYKYKKKNDI